MERSVVHELFDPMARKFVAAMRVALPGKQPGFYEWAYLFAVGALTQSVMDERAQDIAEQPITGSKTEVLRSFITAAWRHG
jgi:hypothetical protein